MFVLLNCLCSLFLLPYGLVCALFGIKNLFDPWFTDEVWGSSAPPQLNPRIFLFEMDGVMSEIMGVAPLPYSKLEGAVLVCGAMGAFGSWIVYPPLFYFCNYLLLFSGVYFALVIPYAFFSRQAEIAPVMLACLLLCLITTGIRAIIIADDPYDKPPYTSSLGYFGLTLVLLSALQTFFMAQNSAKAEDSIAKFHAIKQHFLANGMVWTKGKPYPAGYLDENALLGKV
jgi:hypothetical protein